MFFSDIHVHLLYGTDDGAGSKEEMLAMADKLYADGVRILCATPHCFPAWCGDNRERALAAFSELCAYCKEKYPDMAISLGNELFYDNDGMSWLKNGFCKTMNGTRYVLVEFPLAESEAFIKKAVHSILNFGLVPIIAHAERYLKLSMECISVLRQSGAFVQVNCRRNFGGFDFREKHRVKKMLSLGLVDVVSTDAHNMKNRVPYILEFYNLVSQKYGVEYADRIFYENARKIIFDDTEEMK